MKKLLLMILFPAIIYPQSTAQKFFDALIYDKENISDYVNKDELLRSERLGIKYTGVKNKFLISYEIPTEIKEGIKNGNYEYEVKEQPFADTYTQVTFKVPAVNYSRVYYFDDGFVSPSTYYSWLWTKKESRYFKFRISEPKYFNDYCIKKLDDFVDMAADTLGFTEQEKRFLEKEKIYYTFCKDENEVQQITGFKAKGLALLAGDEVVTSYQTHFHEVAHILINYKLKNLGLYTLPFFMEGFAVAVGGRGGMAPRVVTDIGYYLQKTGFLSYDSILTNELFYNNDASMTYAVSGLYNSFLLQELGGGKYLELYKKVNGDLDFVKGISFEFLNLPSSYQFDEYINDYFKHPGIYFDERDTNKPEIIFKSKYIVPVMVNEYWKFFLDDNIFISFERWSSGEKRYISRMYISLMPNDTFYNSYPAEYGVFADSTKVQVINFFNDEVVLNYDVNFSLDSRRVPYINNKYTFFIRENIMNINNVKEFMIVKPISKEK